ncbi:hypothetical protein PGTUg99_036369 [Puccinia graminis f. sp. tritici]|uniref:Uncharacterized protein n=1 Tax=Puccinia graminis f. sp. tritici TaxID=56615 RepID=A0A5B0QW60_PUCGR|nr:hypothetical protein PGTUg99_036369 [Puccinia graminis f. sp. tritici]
MPTSGGYMETRNVVPHGATLGYINSDRYAFKGKLNRLHERPTRGDFDYKMPLAQRVSLLQPSTAPAQIFPVYQLTRLKASTKNIPTDN